MLNQNSVLALGKNTFLLNQDYQSFFLYVYNDILVIWLTIKPRWQEEEEERMKIVEFYLKFLKWKICKRRRSVASSCFFANVNFMYKCKIAKCNNRTSAKCKKVLIVIAKKVLHFQNIVFFSIFKRHKIVLHKRWQQIN